MAPVRTPEGFTSVAKAPGVAAKLLDAAEATKGADRQDDVRSVTGAYHVRNDVFETYQSIFGNEEAEAADADGVDGNVTEAAARTEGQAANGETLPLDQNPEGAPAGGDTVGGDEPAGTEAPTADWTHDQLNEYASKLTPPLELTGSSPAKAEKVQLIADHIEQNKA